MFTLECNQSYQIVKGIITLVGIRAILSLNYHSFNYWQISTTSYLDEITSTINQLGTHAQELKDNLNR